MNPWRLLAIYFESSFVGPDEAGTLADSRLYVRVDSKKYVPRGYSHPRPIPIGRRICSDDVSPDFGVTVRPRADGADVQVSVRSLFSFDRDNCCMRFMRYYKSAVLAMFQSQSEKYDIQIDEFEGTVRLRDSYYRVIEARNEQAYINVAFGFRACKDGEWAVAAYGPDLEKASPDEQQPWSGFRIDEDAFSHEPDHRFKKWTDRYLMGSWDVPEGPFALLDRVASQLNAISSCVANSPLFNDLKFRSLCFPLAENNHRYQDAHSEVYKLAIDGLNKGAIKGIADRLGIKVNVTDKTTLNALEKVLPSEAVRVAVRKPMDHISEQRRFADHRVRPDPSKFPAFEEFGKDMRALGKGLEILRDELAERLDVNIAQCEKRASAISQLPVFDTRLPSQSNYGIFSAFQMQGKRVVRVQAGELISKPGRPESEEALVLDFSDGSQMSIEAATNLTQLLHEREPIRPASLHISL